MTFRRRFLLESVLLGDYTFSLCYIMPIFNVLLAEIPFHDIEMPACFKDFKNVFGIIPSINLL